jgi:hypothetical protein
LPLAQRHTRSDTRAASSKKDGRQILQSQQTFAAALIGRQRKSPQSQPLLENCTSKRSVLRIFQNGNKNDMRCCCFFDHKTIVDSRQICPTTDKICLPKQRFF